MPTASLLTVANPRLGKINFKNLGGGEARASVTLPPPPQPRMLGFPSLGLPAPGPQTGATHLPPQANRFLFYPPGPGRDAAPGQPEASARRRTLMLAAAAC